MSKKSKTHLYSYSVDLGNCDNAFQAIGVARAIEDLEANSNGLACDLGCDGTLNLIVQGDTLALRITATAAFAKQVRKIAGVSSVVRRNAKPAFSY